MPREGPHHSLTMLFRRTAARAKATAAATRPSGLATQPPPCLARARITALRCSFAAPQPEPRQQQPPPVQQHGTTFHSNLITTVTTPPRRRINLRLCSPNHYLDHATYVA